MNLAHKVALLNQENLKSVIHLNSGGCGIFCYLIYRQLESLGIECKIAAYSYGEITNVKENISNYLNNKSYEPDMACSHFVIEAEGFLFDGYSLYTDDKAVPVGEKKGYFTIEELTVSLNVGGNWNQVYNRTQNQWLIDNIIKTITENIW